MKHLRLIFLLLSISKLLVAETSYWTDTLDELTIRYAWHTYRQFFMQQMTDDMIYEEFCERVKKTKVFTITDEEYVAMNVGNERLERYWGSKTPEEFYPHGDRPRGNIDIHSITMLMETTQPVSPILLGLVKYKDGFEQIISLDGMHRVIAAHLSGRSIAVCVVDLR